MALVLRVLLILQVLLVQQVRQVQQVRLHHLHYRVDDPLAAMKVAGGPTSAEPVILQGIGVGVRVGSEFVLFERTRTVGPAPRVPVTTTYADIARWLTSRGFDVQADAARVAELSQLVPGHQPDHIAFSLTDLPAAVAQVQRAGVRVTWRNDTNDASATFRIRSGGPLVEFVRDPDQPELYWCTMHPDVRSAVEGTCPFCKMALVPIPPPRIGEFRIDVVPIAGATGHGLAGLQLAVRDPDSDALVSAFATVHDKLLHLFVVSRALDYFAHLHPQQRADGTFEVRQAIPPGEYMVIADFLPQGGSPQMVQRAIVTPGFDPIVHAPMADSALAPSAAEAIADGVHATLNASPMKAGQVTTLRFTLAHGSTRAPITDLQPYLSAPAHLFLVSADLTYAVHGHPADAGSFGPELSFAVTLPGPGSFKLWLQVQRRGRVITFPFVVAAR